MTAAITPLPRLAGGRPEHALTRRALENHLIAVFPKLTRSAANRSATTAMDVQKACIDIDVIRWAEADVNRRRLLAGLPLLLKGFDPTGTMAARNIDQAVARS